MAANLASEETYPKHETVMLLLKEKNGVEIIRERYPQLKVGDIVFNDYDWWTWYFVQACIRGKLRTVQTFLKLGVDVATKNVYGDTALMAACDENGKSKTELVAWLLGQVEVCAHIDEPNNAFGYTALHYAAKSNNTDVAYLLLCVGGADYTKRDNWNRTAAEYNTGKWTLNSVAELIENFASLADVGEWRPRKHARFPLPYRVALRTLYVLAKVHTVDRKNTKLLHSKYPQACLDMLPEELLQYLFIWIASAPLPKEWLYWYYRG